MNLNEKHPEVVGYIMEIKNILREKNSPYLDDYLNAIKEKTMPGFYTWLSDLNKKNLLPPEIDKPLTNLYWAIR